MDGIFKNFRILSTFENFAPVVRIESRLFGAQRVARLALAESVLDAAWS